MLRADATADVPPRSSMMVSAVTMPDEYSRNVNVSRHHALGIVTDCELGSDVGVKQTRKDVVDRLRALPDAFEISDAELCRRIGIKPTAWANYVAYDGKRKLPVKIAIDLCDEFNVTLDWIFRGKTALLPKEILRKLRRIAA